MLHIYFGEMEGVIFNPEAYFKFNWEKSWVEDELSVKMIEDIDKSKVVAGGVIDSPVFGLMPPERLSGGVKTLILIYHVPEEIFNASACGDNCAKWLVEIGKRLDVTINLRHFMHFSDMDFDAHVVNGDEYTHSARELYEVASKYM